MPLIEGSTDTTWGGGGGGGGAPFHLNVYDSEDPLPGNNNFGVIATRVRDRRIQRMKNT